MAINPEYHTLKNGIRLVHMSTLSPVAHLGVFINTGTRDEPEGKNGLAHFIEHMIFKGTKKRKAYHILNRLESVGGELNAFTTKEYTCIYTSFLNTWYSRAAELLSDIVFNSVFPAREMGKEKDIIIEEINSYLDTPSEQIYDDFEEALFKGYAMGRSILGTPENVKGFRQKDVLDFFNNCYGTDRMVICSVGGVSFPRFGKYIEKYFNGESRNTDLPHRLPAGKYVPFKHEEERRTYQSHSIIGSRAYARDHEHRFSFGLLNNILGGPGLNSRLNMMVREKYGYAYSIDSFYYPYSDTGIWGVYLGTHNGTSEKAIKLVMKELKKLRESKLGSLQLSQAKKQYRGQIAIAFDSNINVMLSGGRSCMHDYRLLRVEDIYKRIEKIRPFDLLEVANEIFDPDHLSSLTYKSTWNS
ncbi:MAG: insulinase family protein [Bacteroidales bacterium]|nr:insulinase family protein [Bacteroidales bacterium]